MNGYRTYITAITIIVLSIGMAFGLVTGDEAKELTEGVEAAANWPELFSVVTTGLLALGLAFLRKGVNNDAKGNGK